MRIPLCPRCAKITHKEGEKCSRCTRPPRAPAPPPRIVPPVVAAPRKRPSGEFARVSPEPAPRPPLRLVEAPPDEERLESLVESFPALERLWAELKGKG